MGAVEVIFGVAAGLIVYTHVGYPLALALVARLRAPDRPPAATTLPTVSLIVAAHDEEAVIADKVRNALALDYPRELLEVIVASDGSDDATVARAEAAGADVVLDLDRAGKLSAQNAAVERSTAELVAFSDANADWSADALRELVAPFAGEKVGYVCGQA